MRSPRNITPKAGRIGDGKQEATAAKNFDRALMLLQKNKKQGLQLLDAIAEKYEGTPHGQLADTLGTTIKP